MLIVLKLLIAGITGSVIGSLLPITGDLHWLELVIAGLGGQLGVETLDYIVHIYNKESNK